MSYNRAFTDCNIKFWLKFEVDDGLWDGKFAMWDERSHKIFEDMRLGNWQDKISEFINVSGGDLTVKANSDTIPLLSEVLKDFLPP